MIEQMMHYDGTLRMVRLRPASAATSRSSCSISPSRCAAIMSMSGVLPSDRLKSGYDDLQKLSRYCSFPANPNVEAPLRAAIASTSSLCVMS